MNTLLAFVFGSCTVTTPEKNAHILAEIFLCGGIGAGKMKRNGKSVSARIPAAEMKSFRRAAEQTGFSDYSETRGGLPFFLSKYRMRAGLAVGVLAAAALLCASGLFVWRIDIVGNSKVSSTEILELLSEQGVMPGSLISSINVGSVENSVLVNSPSLSWIALNIRGTVIRAEVRETETALSEVPEGKSANVIALCDGQITLIELYEGTPVVNTGDCVRKGQLIASGLIENKDGSFRTAYARGKIYAVTEHTFTVEVPYAYKVKCYKSEKCAALTLTAFSKALNIYDKTGISYTYYDTIVISEELTLPTGDVLPVRVTKTIEREYETGAAVLSAADAAKTAELRMSALLARELCGCELLTKITQRTEGTDSYTVACTVTCIRDIAVSQPFEIADGAGVK